MRKYVLVFMVCLVAVGCANTKVFMGSYDSVKITVSCNQAQMTVENLPYETQSSGEKLERKISEGLICVDTTESDSCKTGNTQGKLHVTIVCSDEKLVKELSNIFGKDGFTVNNRFHGRYKSTSISKVTIYPKRKVITDTKEEYHLIEFETMGDLSCGTHRLFVKEPLAFMFKLKKIKNEIKKITMFITYSNIINNCNFIVKENDIILPDDSKFKVLLEIISTMRKPIKMIFTTT
jgi:hypothetical protein